MVADTVFLFASFAGEALVAFERIRGADSSTPNSRQ
jgi:hypothetical protein